MPSESGADHWLIRLCLNPRSLQSCSFAFMSWSIWSPLVAIKTFLASIPAIGGGGLAGVVCVAVILFVALIPFFAFRNVSRELGPGRLNAMLFGTTTKA